MYCEQWEAVYDDFNFFQWFRDVIFMEGKSVDHKLFNNVLVIAGGSRGNKSAANNQSKLILILTKIFDEIDLVTFCDNGHSFHLPEDRVHHLDPCNNLILSFIADQLHELKAIRTISRRKNFDLLIFTMGRDLHILPILYAKMKGKKVVLRSSGRPTKIISEYLGDKYIVKSMLFKIIEEINYRIVDRIFTECEYAIIENDFEKYEKAYSANLYIDTVRFYCKKEYSERQFDVGYIGRFSEEKGILDLIKSIKLITRKKPDLKVFIAGEGNLLTEMIGLIGNENIQHNITLHRWIPHSDLPDYLNEIKLILIPSVREGLPNMALEAMACRTTVLATPVGSIPGVIRNGETGFIIEENTPDGISNCVLNALNSPNLGCIAQNAESLVYSIFSFEKTVESFRRALYDI